MRDLTTLASDAAAALSSLWDAIGVAPEERAAFVSQLGDAVASVYASRVTSQEERKASLEVEIEALLTTRANMLIAMEETRPQPSPGGRTLTAYRDALDAERAALQEVWDERSVVLKARECALFQLYADIGLGIEVCWGWRGSASEGKELWWVAGDAQPPPPYSAARVCGRGRPHLHCTHCRL